MKLALVRHGPTRWNEAGKFQGVTDVPLSPAGRHAARAIAAALRPDNVTAIYSSDLRRARETAVIVARQCGAPVITDGRLREFDFGTWEGLTWPEIVAAHPHLAGQQSKAAAFYAPEGGERFTDVRRRVLDFLNSLKGQAPTGLIVVVTHAGVLHALFAELGLDSAIGSHGPLRFAPAGITRITIERNAALLDKLDDVTHLDVPH